MSEKVNQKQVVYRVIDVLLMILWPFLVLYFVYLDKIQLIAIALFIYFIVRFAFNIQFLKKNKRLTLTLSITGIILSGLSSLLKTPTALLYYPVMVNLVLLCVFGFSLYKPPSLIEQLARLKHADLSPFAQRYTYKVTQIWCLFFIVNGSIALTTALWGDLKLWGLWNGAISYVCMGLLFLIEWCVRQKMQAKDT